MNEQFWYDVTTIVDKGLILDTKGKRNYRYVIRLIKAGKLQAEKIGSKYRIHRDWIEDFNKS